MRAQGLLGDPDYTLVRHAGRSSPPGLTGPVRLIPYAEASSAADDPTARFGRRRPSRSSPLAVAPARSAACARRARLRARAARGSVRGRPPPSDAAASFSDQTLRLNLTPLRAGKVARVRLSNRFGTQPITFDRVYLGKQRSGARLGRRLEPEWCASTAAAR